jgi:hypothetical protein
LEYTNQTRLKILNYRTLISNTKFLYFKFNLTFARICDACTCALGQFESTKQERVESFFPEIKYIVKGGEKLGIKIPIPRYAGKGTTQI